jgi:hypothetical protein
MIESSYVLRIHGNKKSIWLFGVFIRKLTSTNFDVQMFNHLECNESGHCQQQVQLPGLSISINSVIRHDIELAVPGSVLIFILISIILIIYCLYYSSLCANISQTVP